MRSLSPILLVLTLAYPAAAETVRARVIAPFSTWASYRGAAHDGYSISGAGVSFTIEHGAMVVEAGVRTDYFSSDGYGAAFDARVGGRLAVIGTDGDGDVGLDAVAMVGLRHLQYTDGTESDAGTERVVFATGAVALELSRRVSAQRFTGRVIATGLKAVTDEVRAPATGSTLFVADTGVEAGVELGVAF